MRTVILRLTAQRTETISKLEGTNRLSISLADLSITPLDSVIFDSIGTKGFITNIIDNEVIEYIPANVSVPLVFSRGGKIKIESSFRFASEDILITETDLNQHFYEGRLTVTDINESFGSFIEKNQIISNANIQLINSDKVLTDIFHTYNLTDKTIVNLYYGNTNNFSDYNLFFAGITNKFSNFQYNDEIFTFSAKDNRSLILDTKIPNTFFDPSEYPEFETYDINNPIISIQLTTAVPADWVKDMFIKNVGESGTARISYKTTDTIYLYNYTGNFLDTDTISAQGSSNTATVLTGGVTIPLGTSLGLLGDTGHGIGTIKDETPVIVVSDLSNHTLLWAFKRETLLGAFDNWEPVFSPHTIAYTSNNSGYLDKIKFRVVSSQNFSKGSIVITTPEKVTVIDASVLTVKGNASIDLSNLNIKVSEGDNITIKFAALEIGSKEDKLHPFSSVISNITIELLSLYSQPGVLVNEIPVDLSQVNTPANGLIYFNRSKDLVVINLDISKDNGITWENVGSNIDSNTDIPFQVAGIPINKIKLTINFNTDISFVKAAELYNLVIKFGTQDIKGTKLEEDSIGEAIPIIYGDFSNTLVPATRVDTVVASVVNLNYIGFTNVSLPSGEKLTNALNYTKNALDDVALVGDMLDFTITGLPESVFAKITAVEDSTTFGTIYFEDFGFIPDISSLITISRETNIYKVSAHSLQEISAIKYTPKNAKEPVILVAPNDPTVILDLANGLFSINGVNSKEDVFVSCKGKPKGNTNVLLESPLDILKDLVDTFLGGLFVTIADVDLGNELNSIKMRKYINEETTFGELLESIQKNTNTHIRINTNNVLEVIRFTSSITPVFSYIESEIVPGSLEELYDPDSIVVTGLEFLYNYDPRSEAYLSIINRGLNKGDNSLEFEWLWQKVDASLIADQTFKIMNKVPEIIHCIILEEQAMSVSLGNVIKIEYRGEEHIIFCYQVLKRVNSGELEVYGWNIAHNYDFNFSFSTGSNFPLKILEKANWSKATAVYEPYSLTNPFMDDADVVIHPKNLLANFFNEGIDMGSGIPSKITFQEFTPLFAPLGNAIEIITSGNSGPELETGAFCYTNKLKSMDPLSIRYWARSEGSLNWDRIIISFVKSSDIPLLTGRHSNDVSYLSVINNQQTISTNLTKIDVSNKVPPDPSYDTLVIHLFARTKVFFYEPYIYYPNNRNRSYDSFAFWNSKWPLSLKKYFLDRFTPENLPPNNSITDLRGRTEYIIKGF